MASDTERNLPILEVDGKQKTTVGNYFISNYPPYSFWTADQRHLVETQLDTDPSPETPLGLYVHIPFCRKRCDFCYFKVYTDKNAEQIRRYLDAVLEEMRQLADRPYLRGRKLDFVYFGGGTPSYLSVDQLQYLFEGLQESLSWEGTREISFECEPGTLQEKKIFALREMGITRLSLGIENFNPEILELNNRAHRAKEIFRAYEAAQRAGFPQINIDLIAGMVGETDDNWRDCIEQTLKLAPESVTIYQMEIPYNTTIYQQMKDGKSLLAPVADWDTKRLWVSEGFDRLIDAGYVLSSAYTATKGENTSFLYRDALWRGADMIGIGVSSIAHVGGIHYQNEHKFDPYVERAAKSELPIWRAYATTPDERFIREFILQLKLGRVECDYFRQKFDVDILDRFSQQLTKLESEGFLTHDPQHITLTRDGLLQADGLLPNFFLEAHQDARYA